MPEDPTEFIRRSMPLAATLGIEAVLAGKEEVRLALPWRSELCTSGGLLHGGTLLALADTAGGLCAFLNLPPDAGTATTSSTTHFLRGVRDGRAVAISRPLHVGRSVIVVETTVTDAGDRVVAKTTQSQAVLTGKA